MYCLLKLTGSKTSIASKSFKEGTFTKTSQLPVTHNTLIGVLKSINNTRCILQNCIHCINIEFTKQPAQMIREEVSHHHIYIWTGPIPFSVIQLQAQDEVCTSRKLPFIQASTTDLIFKWIVIAYSQRIVVSFEFTVKLTAELLSCGSNPIWLDPLTSIYHATYSDSSWENWNQPLSALF